MPNKHPFLISILLLVILILSSATARARIVIVGVYDNTPMISMGKSGPEGLFIDILEHVAGQEGWVLQYRYGEWEKVFTLVKSGELDILPAVALKESRRKDLDYNRDALLSNWGGVYTRRGMKVESILDLSGKRIAIQPNDTHGEYFSDLIKKLGVQFTRVPVADYTEILGRLDDSSCDAGVVNFINAKRNARHFDIRTTPIVFNPVEIHFATPKGDPARVLPALDRSIPVLKKNPASVYHTSMEKWFGITETESLGWPVWLKWIIGSAGVIFLASLTLIIALRRVVKVKTNDLVKELRKRKETEKALKFQALLLNNIQDHVTATDLDGNVLYANKAALKHAKRSGEGVSGEPVRQSPLHNTLENGRWRGEVVNHDSDGAKIILDCRARLLKNEEGEPWRMVSVSTDITERKRSEEERELLLTAIEQSPETILITDADGTIQYANSAFETLTGFRRQTLIGQNPRILQSGKHSTAFYRGLWETISSGKPWKGEITNRKKDGALFTEETSISPVRDDSGSIVNYVAVKRDITEELKMKARLSHAQQLEAIGTLAGGIAHDFNNILFPILGYTEILIGDTPPENNTVHSSLQQIRGSALRAKDLVQQILTFSRQEKTEYRPLKIQLIAKEVIKLLRSTIPKNIEIKQYIDPNCSAVHADATQIHQILMNLATNAYHAMEEDGGELKIELQQVDVDTASPLELPSGRYARLLVSDSGVGMTPELVEKVFDPYFTTKEKGRGTGIGLSVVHGIVNKMNGHIRIDTAPGEGTNISIHLPVDEAFENAAGSRTASRSLRRGSESILLIDDEEIIAAMQKQALEKLGYKVAYRISPLEALEAFKARPDSFDLVLTDLSMPKMNGDQLAIAIHHIRPDLPVVLCTGFGEKLTPEKINSAGIRDIIMKPVVMTELSEKIRKALDEPNEK
ncbi:MAG: PAS domain S-box protein [Desulfobacterales bacterium]|nr:PAS domain S-box protein [Desulfobacterales bacterium]